MSVADGCSEWTSGSRVDSGDDDAPDADARLTGSAAALYLALWNRGDEIDVRGNREVLDRWRETQRIGWT